MQNTQSEPVGLSGWLIPLGIGVVIMPLLATMAFLSVAAFISETGIADLGSWYTAVGTFPGVVVALVVLVLLGATAGAGTIAAVLFFGKSRRFPPLMIGLLLVPIAIVLLDAGLTQSVQTYAPADSSIIADLFRSALPALIWIPYLRTSRRVANTFVNPQPETDAASGPVEAAGVDETAAHVEEGSVSSGQKPRGWQVSGPGG